MTMKKKILSTAVLAAMGIGSAHAVYQSPDGLGEVLLVPYYTVQDGNETIFAIVNTTDYTKAVKVRFREAYNSREVLDFNLYLSPHDVWTAKVQDDGNGGAEVVTGDKSCTAPAITTAIPFRNFEFTGSKVDNGPTDQSRVREGYIEIIDMATGPFQDDSNPPAVWDANDDGHVDTTHINGVPENCATMVANWAPGGAWATSASNGVSAPIGGLFGSAAVINVGVGTEISEPVTTLAGFTNIPIHTFPGSLLPNLDAAVPVSDVVWNNDVVNEGFSPLMNFSTDSWTTGIDAVSATLMAVSAINEYTVNPAVFGETDWVLTFPTKFAYVDQKDPAGLPDNVLPFSDIFVTTDASELSPYNNGKACESGVKQYFDREERFVQGDVDFSPLPPGSAFEICYEANVINFGASDVLASENVDVDFTLVSGFNSGWASIAFPAETTIGEEAHYMDSLGGTRFEGLPMVGFRATRILNSNVGVGAAYAVSDEHKYRRIITVSGS